MFGVVSGVVFGVVLKIHKTQNDPLTTDTRVEHKTEAKSGELNGSNGLSGSKNGPSVDLNLNQRT